MKISSTIWIYTFFTLLYQISTYYASIAIIKQGISWYYFPAGIVLLFFLIYGVNMLPVYFVNIIIGYTYIFNYPFSQVSIFYMAVVKCANYYIFTYLAKNKFKLNVPFESPADLIIFCFTGLVIATSNALGNIYVLLNISFEFSFFFLSLFSIWVLGDIIGHLFILPFSLYLINDLLKDPNLISSPYQYVKFKIKLIKRQITNYRFKQIHLLVYLQLILIFIISSLTIALDIYFRIEFYYLSLIPVILLAINYGYKGAIIANLELNIIFFIIVGILVDKLNAQEEIIQFQFFLVIVNVTTLILGKTISDQREEKSNLMAIEKSMAQQKKLDAVGRSTSKIAHDFKNIIQIESGYIDLLLEMDLDRRVKRDLLEMKKNMIKGKILINNLLTFDEKAIKQLVDVNEQIIMIDKSIQSLISKEITLKYDLDSNLPKLDLVSNHLEQIIINLVINSRDAITDEGVIEIRTEYMVINNLKVANRTTIPAGEYIIISVMDNGSGIADKDIDSIFSPFFTTKVDGSGLGLFSIYRILSKYESYIDITSKIGEGTRIDIYFKK